MFSVYVISISVSRRPSASDKLLYTRFCICFSILFLLSARCCKYIPVNFFCSFFKTKVPSFSDTGPASYFTGKRYFCSLCLVSEVQKNFRESLWYHSHPRPPARAPRGANDVSIIVLLICIYALLKRAIMDPCIFP